MKVAIYCRLSEEDRGKLNATDDSESIKNQKELLANHALDQGWEIYDVYSDDDYTGADRNRPQFKRLIADAEAGKFDIVLCKSQSRFTREMELVERYIHFLFPMWGIRFIGLADNADTANRGNKKARQINGLVNEWYLEDLSDNIRAVFDSKRKNGYHIGAFALYGYKKDPDRKGHLIIDEEAAAVVREVFTLFANGYGKANIARILNDRGIPNPTEYKRQHGLRYKQPDSKNSTLWKYFAISHMLVNEIYIGNMVQGRYGSVSYKTKKNKPRPKSEWYIVEGTHEPIIDRELWDRVQRMIAEKARPFSNGQIGIFAKKTRCACCGYTLRSHISSHRRFLRCPTRYVARDACPGAYISVSRLEKIVLGEINRLASEYLDADELERGLAVQNNLTERRERLKSDIEVYRKRHEEYSKGLRDLYMDKVKGLISESDFSDMSKEFSDGRDRMDALIRDAEAEIEGIDERIASGDDRKEAMTRYASLDHLDRPTVETLIDFIEVGTRIQGTRDVPIKIHWNF